MATVPPEPDPDGATGPIPLARGPMPPGLVLLRIGGGMGAWCVVRLNGVRHELAHWTAGEWAREPGRPGRHWPDGRGGMFGLRRLD